MTIYYYYVLFCLAKLVRTNHVFVCFYFVVLILVIPVADFIILKYLFKLIANINYQHL